MENLLFWIVLGIWIWAGVSTAAEQKKASDEFDARVRAAADE